MRARVLQAAQVLPGEDEESYLARMERIQKKRELDKINDARKPRRNKPTDKLKPPPAVPAKLDSRWDGVSKLPTMAEVHAAWKAQKQARRDRMVSHAWEMAIYSGILEIRERTASRPPEKATQETEKGPVIFVFSPPIVVKDDQPTIAHLDNTYIGANKNSTKIEHENPPSKSNTTTIGSDNSQLSDATSLDKVECHDVIQSLRNSSEMTRYFGELGGSNPPKSNSDSCAVCAKSATPRDFGGGGDLSRVWGGLAPKESLNRPGSDSPPTPCNPVGDSDCKDAQELGVCQKPDPETPDNVPAASPYIARAHNSANAMPKTSSVDQKPQSVRRARGAKR